MAVRAFAEPSTGAVPRLAWAVPLVPVAVAGFLCSALLYYHLEVAHVRVAVGLVQGVVATLHDGVGFVPALITAALLLVWSTIWFAEGRVRAPGHRIGRILALTLSLSILMRVSYTKY